MGGCCGAVEHAVANGAQNIVLSGFSTGGAMRCRFFRQPQEVVIGMLMDAPNVDVGRTVDYAASQRIFPVLPLS